MIDKEKWEFGKKNRIIQQKQLRIGKLYRKKTANSINPKMIVRAAFKSPEVVVKIPKRHGSSNGLQGILGNLDYISRNGHLDLENQDGELISGKTEINSLILDYAAMGIKEDSNRREALNVVLSMPPATPPDAVKDAVREFAKETFSHHQWVMVLHTDTDHPHCHLNILLQGNHGKRLNPNLKMLQEWRERFAEKMMEQGVAATATKRQQRGKFNKSENNTIRHIQNRGATAFVKQQQIDEIIDALTDNQRPKNPYLKEILDSKNIVEEQYAHLAKTLYKQGFKNEASMISQLRRSLQQSDTRSQMQKKYDAAVSQQSKPMPNWLEHENNKTSKTIVPVSKNKQLL